MRELAPSEIRSKLYRLLNGVFFGWARSSEIWCMEKVETANQGAGKPAKRWWFAYTSETNGEETAEEEAKKKETTYKYEREPKAEESGTTYTSIEKRIFHRDVRGHFRQYCLHEKHRIQGNKMRFRSRHWEGWLGVLSEKNSRSSNSSLISWYSA